MGFRLLYEAANLVEGHMLVDLLQQEGLEGRVDGGPLAGAAGVLPAGPLVRVMVVEEDYPAARALVDRWNAEQPGQPGQPLQASARPRGRLAWWVAGLLVGVLGSYAWFHAPVDRRGIDRDHDGRFEVQVIYAPGGQALRQELDRNLDGKVDFVGRFDAYGAYESSRADEDFDGVFESESAYKDGNIESSTADTDGDGYPDMRWFYVRGVLHSIDYIQPQSGRALRTEYYRLGRMTHAERDLDGDGRMDKRIRYDATGEVASTEDIR